MVTKDKSACRDSRPFMLTFLTDPEGLERLDEFEGFPTSYRFHVLALTTLRTDRLRHAANDSTVSVVT